MVPVIEKSANLVTGEAADHRVLILDNPHLDGPPATSPTIVAAYQYVLPGEKTPPHRHTPAAIPGSFRRRRRGHLRGW